MAPMRRPRQALAVAVIEDKLYVVGGAPPTYPKPLEKPYNSLEVYDFATNRWSVGSPMPTARHHVTGTALDGKFYVIGGRQPEDFSLSAVERYDPRTDKWEKIKPLPKGAAGAAAVTTESEVVVIGGGDDMVNWVTPATWAFSPGTNAWRRLPDLQHARHGLAAVSTGRRLYAFAGAPCGGFGRSGFVESLAVN